MNADIYLQAMGALSALGQSDAQMRAALFAPTLPDTLQCTTQYTPEKSLPLGMLAPGLVLPTLEAVPARWRSRNNALAWAAASVIRPQIEQAKERYGPHRVGLILGTSTAGVQEGERAAQLWQAQGRFPEGFDYALQEMGNVADFLAHALQITGPAQVISTACSSGAKALASAARWLQAGLVDVVIAGGVDALCSFTVAGFGALESVSAQRCNPLSRHRNGINLGEAGALFVVGREAGPVRLAGWGESQDAHHMSAPEPSGRGAMVAMAQSLQRAGIGCDAIDYINLHGTATPHNDAMESLAVYGMFGDKVPVSSTKPLTGHALAAAGALEAAIAWQVLVDNPRGLLPVHWWDGEADPCLPRLQPVSAQQMLGRPPQYVLSNSFAFGGSNAALVLAAA